MLDIYKIDNLSKEDFVIVTSACSYGGVFNMLEALLTEQRSDCKIINVAEPGRSNKWITHSLMYTLNLLKDHPRDKILTIACLTSIDRKDLHINRETNQFHKTIDYLKFCEKEFITGNKDYRLYKWYEHILIHTNPTIIHRPSGLLSITNLPKDGHESDISLVQIAQTWMKYFYTESGEFEETLNNILSLQYYTGKNNIPLIMFQWQDIWHDTNSTHNGKAQFIGQQKYDDANLNVIHDYSVLEKRIDQYPMFRYLYDQIDFSKWWFSVSKRCETGGLADWLLDNYPNLFGGDKDPVHPSAEGYKIFNEEVLIPLIYRQKNK